MPDKTRSFAIIWDDQAGRAGLGVPGELQAGLTKPELLKALEGGKALRAASLVLRFAQ